MSAESTGLLARFDRMALTFRHWRWQRPFWAGLLTLLGGLPIVYLPYANLTIGQLTVRMATTAGSGSLIIGVLLFVLGLTMWFQPAVRIFSGVAAILLALVSLVVSNFGGFLVGYLPALIGGALAVAWMPGSRAGDEPGAPAELPGDAPASGDGYHAGPDPADDPALPARADDPFTKATPVHAGADGGASEVETTDENGGHRAG